jgi:HAD superfamily hydrolase (TIGR01509 family)
VTGAVLFDVDGTLVDSNDLHAAAWQEAFRHFGVDLPLAVIHGQIGKGGDNLIPALLPPALVEAKQKEIEAYRARLFRRDYLPRVLPFPGVRALFQKLAADGLRIVLATSSHREELDHHIALIGCADVIFASTSKDEANRSKPCPDIFEAALAKAGTRRAIVVGDSPWDVKAACAAGLRTVALRSGGFADEDLAAAGAAAIYDGVGALARAYPAWLAA